MVEVGTLVTGPRRSTHRDAPGELGITEGDLEPVFPALSQDAHDYFTLDRILGYVLASAVGAIIALAVVALSGWAS